MTDHPGNQADSDANARPSGDVKHSVTESVRQELEEQEPTQEQKENLLSDHNGHLVRETTSKLSVESPDLPPGVEIDADAEIPDTYCFTCGEWVGLSGVNLRGRPRSRTEAYYLGGAPDSVRKARSEVADSVADLVESVTVAVPHVNGAKDALDFINAEMEKAEARLDEVNDAK